ncbi:RHS repeat-associated core domain-containing protein, partial [Candidatus Nomurabacteria bacterium]|nr:RHS repeat-associated core domain-containing protein [Candidatus Nomurabacteria bacterium]
TVAITNANQEITHKYVYDAFGLTLNHIEQDYNPFRYVGKYGVMFEDSLNYFMRARIYRPDLGRFLQEDPSWHFNAYSYCLDNPLTFLDFTGENEERIKVISTEDGLKIAIDATVSIADSPSLSAGNDVANYSQAYIEITKTQWQLYQRKKEEIKVVADEILSKDLTFDEGIEIITKEGFMGMSFIDPIRRILGTDQRASNLRYLLSLEVMERLNKHKN